MTPLNLENVSPDWDKVVARFQQALASKTSALNGQESAAWKDLYPGGTGQTLLEFISATLVYAQHSIESSFLETFRTTARRASSVYTIARHLGVRIARKVSPSVTVILSRTSASQPLVIPAWTQWSSNNGVGLVNVEPVVLDVGVLSYPVTLYFGTVLIKSILSDGSPMQEYEVAGSAPFTISDQHLEVLVNNRPWKLITDGLWNYTSADRVVVDATTGEGNLILLFGDDLYGTAPNAGDVILVRWLDTTGTRSAQLPVNTQLTSPLPGVTARTSEAQSPGGNEKGHEFYRAIAPTAFSPQPVTPEQYTVKMLTYPGVVDVVVLFQQDVNPNDLRMMNVAYVSILLETGGTWSREVDTPNPPSFFHTENGSSYLPPGTYGYRVSAVNEVGESLACATASYTTPTPGSLLLRWPTVQNAKTYRVYGRTVGSEQFIAEVRPSAADFSAGRVQWVDTGQLYPSGALPSSNTTRANWWTFVQWMDKSKHASLRLIQMNPTPRPIDVNVNVYAFKDVDDLATLKQQVYERLIELFRPRKGTLGRSFALTDIVTACKVPRKGDPTRSYVDFIDILSPTSMNVSDTVVGRTEFFYLASLTIGMTYTSRGDLA